MQPGPPARVALPSRLLASLRAFRHQPTRHASRASSAVAVASERPPGVAADSGVPPPPPSGAELLQRHLTSRQREHITHEILASFLQSDPFLHSEHSGSDSQGGPGRNGGSRRQRHGPPPRQRRSSGSGSDAAPEAGRQPRGLQGRLAEHLLGGGFDEALLEQAPTNTLNWVIKVLGEQQQAVVGEQLFHWMRLKGRANQHSFAKLCEACAACRQPWRALQAWRVVRRMPQAAAIVGSLAGAALVLCYRSTADHQGAVAALEDLLARRVPVDRYAWNAAIRVCADAGAAQPALHLLGRLRQLAHEQAAPEPQRQQQQQQQGKDQGASGGGAGGSGLRPDCRTYSAALAALAAGGMQHRLPQLHRWMREDGVQPDAPLATQLLSCYAALGDPAAAQKLLDGMAAAAPPPPNRSHWNALLSAYAAAGDTAGAAAAYRRMTAPASSGGAGLRPDCYTLVALLRAAFHARLGLDAVHAVRAEMARHNVQANRQLATAMLCCLRHVSPNPAAPPLWLGHGEPALAEAATAGAAAAPAGGGEAAGEASAAAAASGTAAPRRRRQRRRAGAAAAGGDQSAECLAEAAAVWARMRRQWGRATLPPDLHAFNSLLLVQLAARDYEGVLATYRDLEGEPSVRPDATTLGVVVAACEAAGWPDRAAQFRGLLQSSRLLGALRHDDSGGSGGGGGQPGGAGGRQRPRRSHSGRGGRVPSPPQESTAPPPVLD